MRKIFLVTLLMGFIATVTQSQQLKSYNTGGYDTTRLYNVFLKALHGDTVTLAYLGGSITQGYAASTEANRWVNRVTAWWQAKFPSAHFKMINAGIGGTGSDIGMFRLQRDVLKYNPDLVIVEFSVNDAQGTWATTSMEGLIRQLQKAPGHPAVMMLMLKQSNGTTAKASHEIIGNYYKVPMISFADLIDAAVSQDGISLESIFVDGLHPNDVGMQYIATFITDELEKVYLNVPDTNQMLTVDTVIPNPYVTDTYDRTYMYTNSTLVPETSTGWVNSGTGWMAKNPGDEIVFEVEGNSIAVLFSKHNNTQWGAAEMWVDDYPHKTFEAYWTQTWGPATVFGMVQDQLPDGKHKLHIKISESLPAGSSGHTFYLLNVLKAGNIGRVAPIAVPNTDRIKLIKNTTGTLTASKSYDPDGDSLLHFLWKTLLQPANSQLNISQLSPDSITVRPNLAGLYQIGLQVCDAYDTSTLKVITIEVRDENHLPVAYAGNDTSVKINTTFFLNAYQSWDADNDDLTFSWRLIQQPANSKVILGKPNGSRIPIKVDSEGTYLFGLVVNDGFDNSIEDTIQVVASVSGVDTYGNRSILLFPNPVRDYFYLVGADQLDRVITLEIFTLDGKICLRTNPITTPLMQIKIPYLSAGNYRLVVSGKTRVLQFPLVIVH